MPEPNKAFYTIQEALEWIVFRKDSSKITAEEATSHEYELEKAESILIGAMRMHKLFVLGDSGYSSSNELKEIPYASETRYVFPETNTLEINQVTFYNVKIPVVQIQKHFPPFNTPIPQEPNGYITPYMKIMLETIHEEGLSAENQSKKEVLTNIIAKKMADRGLKESSNLAKAMATLIRMPESQNGRLRKG